MENKEKKDERILPLREVDGVLFTVDVTKMELREVSNSANRLDVWKMSDHLNYHLFVFDRLHRKMERDAIKVAQAPERYATIYLPRIEAIDPEGMRILITRGAAAEPEKHADVLKVKGTDFYLTSKSELQQVENPWNVIHKFNMMAEDGDSAFWYNKAEKRVAFPDEVPVGAAKAAPNVEYIRLMDLVQQLDHGKSARNAPETEVSKNKEKRKRFRM